MTQKTRANAPVIDRRTLAEIARKSPAQITRDAEEVRALATGVNADGSKRRKAKALQRDEEHAGQALFFSVEKPKLVAKYPDVKHVMGIPNFSGRLGKATISQSRRLNDEGRRKGTWDIFYPVARGGHHGLWVECKIRPNTLSAEQREFGADMMAQGHLCVPLTADDAAGLARLIAGTVEAYETLR